MIREGRYRAQSGPLTLDIRIERRNDELVMSGDIVRAEQFLAGFRGETEVPQTAGEVLEAAVRYIGHANLHTGSIRIDVDDRGVGSFQLAVDMQGGLRDSISGEIRWQSSRFRTLSIEIDGIVGTQARLDFTAQTGQEVSLRSAFEAVGFDVTVREDMFNWIEPRTQELRGWTPAEMHFAMEQTRSRPQPGQLQTHVFVCGFMAGPRNRGVLGIMYDWGNNDRNNRPREGVTIFHDHPNLSDPRVPVVLRDREFTYTVVHELGHALNMLHSFDKARPSSLSWMNYPERFPLGHNAGPGHDGSAEFWSEFEHIFDAEELDHLRHGTRREILPGGFSFGRYEDGLSSVFGGPAEPRLTDPRANPLRTTFDVSLHLRPLKTKYELAEPVFAAIQVENTSRSVQVVPTKLDPSEGFVTVEIVEPDGRQRTYRPPMNLCCRTERTALQAGETLTGHPGTPLFFGADGPLFTRPGAYVLRARLTGINGNEIAESRPVRIEVTSPTEAVERYAETVWSTKGGLEALYLRHPLANRDAWRKLVEAVDDAKLRERRGNTTGQYIDYVSALGWLTPFADLRGKREYGMDADRAYRYLKDLRTTGLPVSCRHRKEALDKVMGGLKKKAAVPVTRGQLPSTLDEARDDHVPPSGLFGSAGLSLPGAIEAPIDPFVRVVDAFRGTRRFADVVTWNVEHLHSETDPRRYRNIARLMRDMRCDFWALQEVDGDALQRLVDELNNISSIDFAFEVVDGNGQQSGCVYRTDTTTIDRLPHPDNVFDDTIEVELTNGSHRTKDVFLRRPLLVNVRVRHENNVFDFRAANVHLKSTDSKYKDRGNAHRTAAAETLSEWIKQDRSNVSELDYFVFGDLNAETSDQGLGPFLEDEDFAVLSLGMKEEYGETNSLTRVASKRTLDHIIVTDDTRTLAPERDLGEQIVIRTDRRISNFTNKYSDHIPVAARFIISEDDD